jgi:hypothetical protein
MIVPGVNIVYHLGETLGLTIKRLIGLDRVGAMLEIGFYQQ